MLTLQNKYGNTLLHEAVEYDSGNFEIIKIILDYAQQLGILDFMFRRNIDRETPVDRAYILNRLGQDRQEVVKLLREYTERSEIDFDSLEESAKKRWVL